MTESASVGNDRKTLTDLVTRGRKKPPGQDPERTEREIARDQFLADQGKLSEEFVGSKFWADLVRPAIEQLYMAYDQDLKAGNGEALGGLKFADDLVTCLGGKQQLAKAAIERIMIRQLGAKNVLPMRPKEQASG